jgi:isocitrate lyase
MADATDREALHQQAHHLLHQWRTHPRWTGIRRDYTAWDVIRLRGSIQVEHTLAAHGATRLWNVLQADQAVAALGAMTGGQAVQMVKAGVKAISLSGW